MKRELLRSYFEKTCSASEAAMVEEWLLHPQHQAEFEAFLEAYWEEHTREAGQLQPVPLQKRSALRRYIPRLAAAAAITGAVLFSIVYFSGKRQVVESDKTTAVAVVTPEQLPAGTRSDTFSALLKDAEVKKVKTKTKQYGKKHLPEPAVAYAAAAPAAVNVQDTAGQPAEPRKTVKATVMTKFMFNDSAFCKLSKADQLTVINRMALRVDFNNASFSDLVANFRNRYGIVLELCEGTTPDKLAKVYTARFEGITLPDLINDMSGQMAFSYSVTNNVVKVCFN